MHIKPHLIGLAALILLLVAIPACGGDDEDDITTSSTSQAATTTSVQPTSTQPTTTATNDKDPVKIGVVSCWSGTGAIIGHLTDNNVKTVGKQLEDMGGILGGRPVEFVKFDTGGQIANAAAGVTKLVTKDDVSVLVVGGASAAEFAAVSGEAEREKVLFVSVGPVDNVWDTEYTVEGSISYQSTRDDIVRLVLELLTPTPRTFGFLCWNDPSDRSSMEEVTQRVEDAGKMLGLRWSIRSSSIRTLLTSRPI